jgi:hypothetical protein
MLLSTSTFGSNIKDYQGAANFCRYLQLSSWFFSTTVIDMEFFGATGPDPLKPSLFELIAQEQLRDLLQPALKYVLAV